MEYDPIPEPSSSPSPGSAPPPSAGGGPGAREAADPHRRRLAFWLGLPIATVLLAALTGVGVAASIQRPQVEKKLEDFVPRLVTRLHDRDSQVFKTYQRENRVLLEEGDVPELLQNAIVAAEDASFFQHGGIDVQGIVRAAVANFKAGRKVQGASTITMQLARELFLTREKSYKRKIEEAFLSVELEKQFSKQQLLTLYCNLVNLGHGNYGMEAAARNYFNKSVGELTLAEAATLAGIPQRPTDLSVYRDPERVTRRRNYVLGRMLEEGFITDEEHRRAVAEPLLVTPRRREAEVGPYFAEEVRRYLADVYGTNALYDKGLVVTTTLDRDVQRAAESALREGLLRLDHGRGWRGPALHLEGDDLEGQKLPSWTSAEPIPGEWYEGIVLESGARAARVKIGERSYELGAEGIEWTRRSRPDRLLERGDVAWFRLQAADEEGAPPVLMLEQEPELEGAVLVLESSTGAIRAMIGGWSFERNEFNRITQAQRQVGSAFKPFVFGAALESGYTAADVLFDGPAVFLGADALPSYSPRNYEREYNGILTLRRALEQSINVPAVKLLDLVGLERVIDFARRCGVRAELPPYPSLALGAADISPLELAAAYASFVNQGVYVEPYLIETVESRDGRLLQEHLPQAHKAMEPQVAYVLTRMLKGVVDVGTGAGVRFDVELGGKTGTTNSYTDAWFVGFSPRYTILSWVGYDQKRSIGRGMTGARAALPIWRSVVKQGLEDGWIEAGATFARPPGIVEVEVEHRTGLRFGPGAQRMVREVFVEGTEPEQKFNPQWARVMDLPWYAQEPFYLPKEGEKMPGQIDDWQPVRESWANKVKKARGEG